MNIEIQSCGLLMLLILLVVLMREKSLDLSRRRKFIDAMLACIVCLTMDIVSIVGIVLADKGTIPDPAAWIICKIYLFFLINVGYRGLVYTAGEFFDEDTHKIFRTVYRGIFCLGVIAVFILPIDYYCEGRVVYSHGPATMATYLMAFIMLVSILFMVTIGGEGTSLRRRRVIITWQLCWIVAAIVQFLRPDLLVVGFAAAFGIVLVYAELENPNEGIDRVTGQFTHNALYIYLLDQYKQGANFSAMHVNMDYSAGEFDLELEMTAMRRVADFLDTDGKSYVFRESDRDFIVLYKNTELMQKDYERADRELEAAVDMPIKIAYTLIPDNTVLKSADEFMQFQHYNVKRVDASNCIIAGEAMAEEMREYLKIRDQINWALANDGVEVYYQPIYDVERGTFSSAEALMRLHDNNGDMVMPGKFIPIAEENGLIIPLGKEIFSRVCRFLATGKAQQLGIDYIEINLSMAQFSEDEPATFVQEVMDKYDIDPRWINLEITETADPTARQVILKNMNTLIDRGVHFSLDDFGTGRSNIDYFVAMPVSIVKFDSKFTHWYFESEKARIVMRSIVEIIDRMELPIVMEGVETKDELDTMIELGASYIQGYYFSKPLPEEEFLEFMGDNVSSVSGR